jgi:hypothetical protein
VATRAWWTEVSACGTYGALDRFGRVENRR